MNRSPVAESMLQSEGEDNVVQRSSQRDLKVQIGHEPRGPNSRTFVIRTQTATAFRRTDTLIDRPLALHHESLIKH